MQLEVCPAWLEPALQELINIAPSQQLKVQRAELHLTYKTWDILQPLPQSLVNRCRFSKNVHVSPGVRKELLKAPISRPHLVLHCPLSGKVIPASLTLSLLRGAFPLSYFAFCIYQKDHPLAVMGKNNILQL